MQQPRVDGPDGPGKDFDNWLDWNGNVDSSPDPLSIPPSADKTNTGNLHTSYPVSPSTSANSDSHRSARNSTSFTATNLIDLPTPSHSLSSPETISYDQFQQTGETARAYPAIARRPVLKRKLSPNEITNTHGADDAKPASKKRPHNVIEKRYRANLNEKIAELRDSVPSLRISKKAADDPGPDSENEDQEGLPTGSKLNKASILTKAVEHIQHLETRNRRLDDENRALKERLQTLDKVLARGGSNDQRAAAFTSEQVIESANESSTAIEADPLSDGESKKSSKPPQGLIPQPESWRRFWEPRSQEHYGHIYDTPSEGRGHTGKWPARIMIGSLAGLMIMEGFSESEQTSTSTEKGLFGIPIELLDGYRFLSSPRIYLAAFAQFCRAGGAIPLLKGFLALSTMAFFVFAYLFNSKPAAVKHDEECSIAAQEAPSLASPMEVRRRAWSTSMQTLKLPHHHFFEEWVAVTAEWLKYTISYLFGLQIYTWITGRSGDDEAARIKAWDIAIDAQLAGGDPEISRSRVVLTSFGSGTLPRSPLRLMLKALHCRVLLWKVGNHTSLSYRVANKVALFFANREWRKAQQLHEQLPTGNLDKLPSYLAALLCKDCDDVLNDSIIQRAFNLMYDRPTSEYSEDRLMDVIVEDHAIRSPLDAVAAWWSTQMLRLALLSSIQNSQDGVSREQLNAALLVAPPGSAAQTRAFALHALFHQHRRPEYFLCASNSFPEASILPPRDTSGPYFIDSSTPWSACSEISVVLRCAKIMMDFEKAWQTESSNVGDQPLADLSTMFSSQTDSMSLLGFASAHFVLQQVLRNSAALVNEDTTNLAHALGAWLQSGGPDVSQVPKDVIEKLVLSTLNLTGARGRRRLSDVSNDTGYETQEDDGDSMRSFQKLVAAPPASQAIDWEV